MIQSYFDGSIGIVRTKDHFILIIDGEMYGKYKATRENSCKLLKIFSE